MPPRGARSRAWFVVLPAVVVLGAGAIWALALRRGTPSQGGDEDEDTTPSPARAATDLSRLKEAMAVLSQAHADPAGPERRAALADLLSQNDAPSKLTLLLEAAAADPTAPDKDPLWPDLIQGLSSLWRGEPSIGSGMDLMLIESRPRARDALVSSFAKLAVERSDDMTQPQRQKLTEYFIDLHNRLPAFQQREVEAAARRIAGPDVADLMQGKGMASDDELQVHREYKQALGQAQAPAAATQ